MKKQLLFLVAAAQVYCAVSQPTFEKYYLSAGSYQFNLFELCSHNYFVAMGGAVLTDPDGNVLHNNYYWGNSILSLQSVGKHSDNEFYFVTVYQGDTCYFQGGFAIRHFYPVIGKMDSLGHVQDARRFVMDAGCQNGAGDLEITHDKSVITWGRERSFFALKADSTLEHVWSKHFDLMGGFQFIKELPGGDLLAGINMDTAGVSVARLDPDGNFLWCKSYIRPRGIVHDCVIESDSSFILTGFTDSIASTFGSPPPDYHPKLFMMKLNGTGEVQWCKGYDNPASLWYVPKGLHIKKTLDDKYVVLATLSGQPLLMKTDLNGDTLWTRSAGVNGYGYQTSNLLATSDGGFLYDGAALGNFGSWSSASYLFKTDSLGHLPCSERLPPPLTVSDLFPMDSSFTLSSVDGATTLTTYLQDTIYGSITTYNGCTFTSISNHTETHKTTVHPNPNTGRFTVEFNDPLTVDSFYSVYDAVGQLLFQRPLAKGQESEEIDLSRFAKGTYLVRVSDRNGVCYERVVVQ